MSNKFSFSDLDKTLSKLNEIGGIMDDNDFSKINEFIPTGNYILNACLSGDLFGGIPANRTTAVGGASSVGKSFIALNLAREAIKKGYHVIYYDSENAVDKKTMRKFGIDTSKVRYEPVATVWDFKVLAKKTITTLSEAKNKGKELPKVFMILDSLGNLATTKEHSDAEDGKQKVDMTRAKELKSVFRILTMDLAKLKIPLFLTNHTYDSMSLYGTPTFAGGGGAIYNSSVILLMQKLKLKDDGPSKEQKERGLKKTGIVVKARPNKNRLVRPVEVKFHIRFDKGMNPYIGLHEFVSWEACGIQKNAKIENGELVNSKNGRYAVKHLGKTVPASQLFTSEVFTPEVLKQLNDNVIKDFFAFPDGTDEADYYDVFDEEEIERQIQVKKIKKNLDVEDQKSTDFGAQEAIKKIELLDKDKAKTFLGEDEDRVTVERALENKLEEE